jgi:Protein of unknown function (DUF2690)
MKAMVAVFVLMCAVGCGPGEDVPDLIGQAQSALCGGSCDGKDPISTGCSADAITPIAGRDIVNGVGTVVGHVELRYSRACNARWSKVWNYYGGTGQACMHTGGTYPGSTIYPTCYPGAGGQIYGNMTTQVSRACGDVPVGGTCTTGTY